MDVKYGMYGGVKQLSTPQNNEKTMKYSEEDRKKKKKK